jgi:hypothetical protein
MSPRRPRLGLRNFLGRLYLHPALAFLTLALGDWSMHLQVSRKGSVPRVYQVGRWSFGISMEESRPRDWT